MADASAVGGKYQIRRTLAGSGGITWTTDMVIDSNGNVGIGTTAPSGKLHVLDSVDQPLLVLKNSNATFTGNVIRGVTTRASSTAFNLLSLGVANDSTPADQFVVRGDGQTYIAGNVGIGTTSPSSTLHVAGSQTVKRTATATDYTVLTSDYYVGVTSTAAARTITLPAAATAAVGKVYIIKDESGGAATNNITVDGNAAETIDGAATKVINTNYGSVQIITNGSNWFTF